MAAHCGSAELSKTPLIRLVELWVVGLLHNLHKKVRRRYECITIRK